MNRLILPLCVCVLARLAAGADALTPAELEKEAALIAEEDKADAAVELDKRKFPQVTGILELVDDPAQAPGGVVGTIAAKEATYQLKLGTQVKLDKLAPYNHKQVTLKGRIRLNGKYFVADEIDIKIPGPMRRDHGKRGGS